MKNKQAAWALDTNVTDYFLDSPFDPPEKYPECQPITIQKISSENRVYPMVRELFRSLGLDADNFGTSRWNPLAEIIKPGQTVAIKPNLVTHRHILDPTALYSTISHGSVIRPVIDYLYKALGGAGRIVIADNPVEGADFKALMKFTGIQAMVDELTARGYRGLEVIDLRPRVLKEAANGEFFYEKQPGDPLGYATIDLGHDSMFGEFDDNPDIHYYTLADSTIDHIDPKFVGASLTDRYHNSKQHTYIVSKTVLNADLVIDMAKMKSHCKSGVSMALKNMIGIVYEKHCMPHHRPGSPPVGDNFPTMPPSHYIAARKSYTNLKKYLYIHHIPGVKRFRNWLQKKEILVGKHIEHGNWKGNDTIWRTILDLNRIVLYADQDGTMQDTIQRPVFSLIDGILSQQGEGPMSGYAVPTSIILGGFNTAVTDALAVKAMGLDYSLFKTIARAGSMTKWRVAPEDIDLSLPDIEVPKLSFELSRGWK